MDPYLCTGDQGTVETKDYTRNLSEDGESSVIEQQGHAHSFLGCMWNNPHRLLTKEENDQRTTLCRLISCFNGEMKKKNPKLKKKNSFIKKTMHG